MSVLAAPPKAKNRLKWDRAKSCLRKTILGLFGLSDLDKTKSALMWFILDMFSPFGVRLAPEPWKGSKKPSEGSFWTCLAPGPGKRPQVISEGAFCACLAAGQEPVSCVVMYLCMYVCMYVSMARK